MQISYFHANENFISNRWRSSGQNVIIEEFYFLVILYTYASLYYNIAFPINFCAITSVVQGKKFPNEYLPPSDTIRVIVYRV